MTDFEMLAQLEKCKSMILGLAKRQCHYYGNLYQDPEDLYQDVFLKCWSKCRNGEIDWEHDDHTGLIFQIAQNLCRSAREKTARHRQQLLAFEPVDQVENSEPQQIAMANELDSLIQEAISKLPPTQHLVIQKRFYANMKPQEIASESGDKITSVYKRLNRAKRAISQRYLDSEWLNVM